MSGPARALFRFFASTGLSVALLLLLMLLTFLGTLAQVDRGLYAAQREYFGSLFLVHRLFGVFPVPLPGAYLLLALVFVNVVCGGIVRVRKGWKQAGVLIAHVGILLLLAGGFVTFHYSLEGHVTLYEGDAANTFQSSRAWELVIARTDADGSATEHIVPEKDFADLGGARTRTFFAQGVPFEITASGYVRNARQSAEGAPLETLPAADEPAENIPGVCVSVSAPGAETVHQAVLWGMSPTSWAAPLEGGEWTIQLRRRTWPLPFTLRLDKFTRELHPGTQIPKVFMSEVTQIDGDSEQAFRIAMNEPLRHGGYAFYQASWGPPDAGPNDPLFSSLAVARNPADPIPLYASTVICFGLLVQFLLKLAAYLKAESRARP